MSYKRHDPVPEIVMDKTRFEGHHSVCQILRDIYHLTENEEVKLKARIAMAMAKSMNNKLKKYKELGEGSV